MTPIIWFQARLAGFAEGSRIAEELSRLSDRNLADIGMSRSDVPAMVREARLQAVAKFERDALARREAQAAGVRHA